MKIAFRVVVLAALAALGYWLWTVLFPSPEHIIRRRILDAAKYASFASGEGMLRRAAHAEDLAALFAAKVEVNVNVPELRRSAHLGREEIRQSLLAAQSQVSGLNVKFPDVIVKLNADGVSAVADVTLEARVSGQSDLMVQEMKFTLQKIDGEWLITRVATVRTLSRLRTKTLFALRLNFGATLRSELAGRDA